MLMGHAPFIGSNYEETVSNINNSILMFDEPFWEGVSPQAKKLVERMLEKNPLRRITL